MLNNSTIQGLAASAAGQLSKRGWTIAAVGNFTGRLPETTLFVPTGERRTAKLLAHEFPAITSLQSRPHWLPGTGLTLVLTRYWES